MILALGIAPFAAMFGIIVVGPWVLLYENCLLRYPYFKCSVEVDTRPLLEAIEEVEDDEDT